MRARRRRLRRNSSTSGSPLQRSVEMALTRAALAMPQRTQTETQQPGRADACLPAGAPRHTKMLLLSRRCCHCAKKQLRDSSLYPLLGFATLALRRRSLFQKNPLRPSRPQRPLSRPQPPSCLRPRGSIRAVVALLPASELTCRSTPLIATAAGQHLGQHLGSHSRWAHPQQAIREE